MTSLALLSEAILSGQVPDHAVPALCKEHPGLGWLLERRSRAARARVIDDGKALMVEGWAELRKTGIGL